MDIPFKLGINLYKNEFNQEFISLPVFENVNEINFENGTDIIKIKEYTPFSISINSLNNYRLYFDLFDVIESDILLEDELNNKYLYNNNIKIVDSADSIHSVIVPGYYHLKIKGEKSYHAIIEIIPKDFVKEEWKQILKDLMEENKGLVSSLTNQINSKLVSNKMKSNDLISKLNYIQSNWSVLATSLNLIYSNPKLLLVKNYSWIDKSMSPPVNDKSITMQMKKPYKINYLYSPKRTIVFNNNENKWLKNSIEQLKIYFEDTEKEVDNYIKILQMDKRKASYLNEIEYIENQLIALDASKNILSKLSHIIYRIKRQEWYQDISFTPIPHISYAIMNDNRYRTILKWLNEIYNKQNTLIYNENLRYAWKRTDELYEIWCLIKVIKILFDMGYKADSSWDENIKLINGDIKEGSKFRLTNNNINLNIYFGMSISNKVSTTTIDNPIYTTFSNNKPDIRIDLYIDDVFVQSIPIEIKYRKLHKITKKQKGNIEQLKAYAYNLVSIHHFKGYKDHVRNNQRVVKEVLVIYPNSSGSKNSRTIELLAEQDRLEFYELSPNFGMKKLRGKLEKIIENQKELCKDYAYLRI